MTPLLFQCQVYSHRVWSYARQCFGRSMPREPQPPAVPSGRFEQELARHRAEMEAARLEAEMWLKMARLEIETAQLKAELEIEATRLELARGTPAPPARLPPAD